MRFWAVGYCVSTVGLDEAGVPAGIWEQEKPELGQSELYAD